MRELTSRVAQTEEDGRVIFLLLAFMAEQEKLPKVNPGKALWAIYQVIGNGAAYIVEDRGSPIATMGLDLADWWFSDETFLMKLWWYVRPDYRDTLEAGNLLLREAHEMARLSGLTIYLDLPNEKRRLRNGMERFADKLKFVPDGSIVSIIPREEPNGSLR